MLFMVPNVFAVFKDHREGWTEADHQYLADQIKKNGNQSYCIQPLPIGHIVDSDGLVAAPLDFPADNEDYAMALHDYNVVDILTKDNANNVALDVEFAWTDGKFYARIVAGDFDEKVIKALNEQSDTVRERLEKHISKWVPVEKHEVLFNWLTEPGTPIALTKDEKIALLEDFRQWSGGFNPDEVEEPDRRSYLEYGMTTEFDMEAAQEFIINFVTPDQETKIKDETHVLPFTLPQIEPEDEVKPITGRVEFTNGRLSIYFDGYGTKTAQPGFGDVVHIEHHKGTLTVHVWSDINNEDPTHSIDLEKARDVHFIE